MAGCDEEGPVEIPSNFMGDANEHHGLSTEGYGVLSQPMSLPEGVGHGDETFSAIRSDCRSEVFRKIALTDSSS